MALTSLRNFRTQWFPPKAAFTEKDLPLQQGRVFIVTGGNAGIGFELCKILYASGATIYMASRSKERAEIAIQSIVKAQPAPKVPGTIKFLHLDLNDLESVKGAATTFPQQESRLDVLWNNAGTGANLVEAGAKTAQGFEAMVGMHCIATLLFTELVRPQLRAAAAAPETPRGSVRVVWTSSFLAEGGSPANGIDFTVLDKGTKDRIRNYAVSKDRPRGIIHVRENCYGWYGPWAHRSGWQQISDACCGVSRAYAQAMGHDEAVTPVFPNSDYCTGVIGSAAVLDTLVRRSQTGGSYGVDVSLNYYSQWLVRSCGTYDEDIWNEVWRRHDSITFRHYHAMQHLLPAMLRSLYQHDQKTLFKPEFFEPRLAKNMNATFVVVKPIAQFPGNEVDLKYNVGTRRNGIDQPLWPKDLTVEIVTGFN